MLSTYFTLDAHFLPTEVEEVSSFMLPLSSPASSRLDLLIYLLGRGEGAEVSIRHINRRRNDTSNLHVSLERVIMYPVCLAG